MSTLEVRADVAQKELFHRYDELTELWTKIEQELTSRHVPHSIEFTYWCPSCQEEADIDPFQKALGLAKKNGKWRLCHGEGYYNGHEQMEWTPIVDCSAFDRVELVQYIPKLREAVVAASERFIPKVDKAIAFLKRELAHKADPALVDLLAERVKLNGKPLGQ